MLLKQGAIQWDRFDGNNHPRSSEIRLAETSEEDAPAKTTVDLLADLQVQITELAHGQHAVLLSQSVATVRFNVFTRVRL
jgi:hypothetical protein